MSEKEMQLSGLSSSGQVKQRQILGKLIGADLLILVSPAKKREEILHYAVGDAGTGLRLREGALRITSDSIVRSAKDIVHSVKGCARRKHEGIKTIISIPPFSSKDLSFESDALGLLIASVLRSSLLSYPDVVVVEFAEARAFFDETVLTGSLDGGKRAGSLTVRGSFQSQDPLPGVRLTLQIGADNKEPVTLEAGLSPGETHFLKQCQALAQRVLDVSGSSQVKTERTPLALARETEQLVTHAAVLMEQGAWDSSRQAAEAALVLAPNNTKARMLAMKAYGLLAETSAVDMQDVTASWQSRLRLLARGAPHAEWIVRTQSDLSYDQVRAFDLFIRRVLVWAGPARIQGKTEFSHFSKPERRMISNVMTDFQIVALTLVEREKELFQHCKQVGYMHSEGSSTYIGLNSWTEGAFQQKVERLPEPHLRRIARTLSLKDESDRLQEALKAELGRPQERAPKAIRPQRPIPPKRQRRIEDTSLSQLDIEPISFKNTATGEILKPRGVLDIISCGDFGDLLSIHEGLFFVEEPGLAKPLTMNEPNELGLTGIGWDVSHGILWVATSDFNIYAWTPRSGRIQKWGPSDGMFREELKHTLASQSVVKIIPFEAKLLVVISSQLTWGTPRTWIGLIEPSEQTVTQLWTAKKGRSGIPSDPLEVKDPSIGFRCALGFCVPASSKDDRAFVLLDRGTGLTPLTIRLNPLEVTAGEIAHAHLDFARLVSHSEDGFLFSTPGGIWEHAFNTRETVERHDFPGQIEGWFTAGNMHYFWGWSLSRLDTKTLEMQALVKPGSMVSNKFLVGAMGASKHYGILAYSDWTQEFYQVRIPESE
ncbi:MAG: hypothetical protein HON70_06045 [Lentisphaerae bacterium]|nr:hypothetical protein [Lentisphaerota bacterium]